MFNIREIKSIPLADVARRYGIKLVQKHGRLWGKLRESERTASFSINLAKNLWYDFGSYKGGSAIDLVMELDGIDKTAAINKLAEDFGITNQKVKGWSPLTDSQYRELGIEPTQATLNFNYDLRVHTVEQLTRWNSKYGMSVPRLAELNPEKYNQLVMKIGKETITSIREAYFVKIKHAVAPNITSEQQNLYRMWANENAKEINSLVDLLTRSIKEDSIGTLKAAVSEIQSLKVNTEKDMVEYSKKKHIYSHEVSEDQTIRNNVVDAYKSLYNFPLADYLSVAAAKALLEFNKAVSGTFLPVGEIKILYKDLGKKLNFLEERNFELSKQGETLQKGDNPEYQDWVNRNNNLKNDIQGARELFQKASAAIEGLREASMEYKKEMSNQKIPEKENVRIRGDDVEITTH